jgi:hypothetical protein
MVSCGFNGPVADRDLGVGGGDFYERLEPSNFHAAAHACQNEAAVDAGVTVDI